MPVRRQCDRLNLTIRNRQLVIVATSDCDEHGCHDVVSIEVNWLDLQTYSQELAQRDPDMTDAELYERLLDCVAKRYLGGEER